MDEIIENLKPNAPLPLPTVPLPYSARTECVGCGCNFNFSEMSDIKTNCFFYTESIDMGARIDWCSHNAKMCECKGCKYYISDIEVYAIVCKEIDKRNEEEMIKGENNE